MTGSTDVSIIYTDKLQVIKDIEYFNVEVDASACTLAFNASRKGIDAFLRRLPVTLTNSFHCDLKSLQRPERRWTSTSIVEQSNPMASASVSYQIKSGQGLPNEVLEGINFRLIDSHSTHLIFFVSLQDKTPVLTVNQTGWKQFLDMLNYLRDHSFWFCVLKDPSIYQVPFRLSVPDQVDDCRILSAIECIRLEPESSMYLKAGLDSEFVKRLRLENGTDPKHFSERHMIKGNSAGLLQLSVWFHEFSSSSEEEVLLENKWGQIPQQSGTFAINDVLLEKNAEYIHLKKIRDNIPAPVISFEGTVDSNPELYIFGNVEGFVELSRLIEQYAFKTDHDEMFFIKPVAIRCKGDLYPRNFGDKKFRSFTNWGIIGGGLILDSPYNSSGDNSPTEKIKKRKKEM